MRVACIAPYTAYTARFLYSPLYIKVRLYRTMSQAATLAELQVRLQAKLTSPIPAEFQGHGYEVNLVRGHEAAIRLVDARSFAHACAVRRRWVAMARARAASLLVTCCVILPRSSMQSVSRNGSKPRVQSTCCVGCVSLHGWQDVPYYGTLEPSSAPMPQVDAAMRLLVTPLRHTRMCSVRVARNAVVCIRRCVY